MRIERHLKKERSLRVVGLAAIVGDLMVDHDAHDATQWEQLDHHLNGVLAALAGNGHWPTAPTKPPNTPSLSATCGTGQRLCVWWHSPTGVQPVLDAWYEKDGAA